MKKIIKLLPFGLMAMICWLIPIKSGIAAQYFATKYAFTDQGQLQTPLFVKFSDTEQKKVKAIVTHMDTEDRTLLVACSEGEDVFLADFNKGYEYALYKINFRDNKEDLLILGYGKRGTGKTSLNSLDIVGLNEEGQIGLLPVSGFEKVNVFNSPLQIRNREAVLFRDKGSRLVTLSWFKNGDEYLVTGAQN
ncbi:MAG: hypothetical protein LKJ99_05150 [Acidaminococcaceae bacterium]|jgi:hypothetical protein|nr:hypothetical protein [Acidaminococcaceae bacterium]MCI2110345.1 hypothetical protein [Acidaminococcaceae bacterium]